jgi:hypothetical protein
MAIAEALLLLIDIWIMNLRYFNSKDCIGPNSFIIACEEALLSRRTETSFYLTFSILTNKEWGVKLQSRDILPGISQEWADWMCNKGVVCVGLCGVASVYRYTVYQYYAGHCPLSEVLFIYGSWFAPVCRCLSLCLYWHLFFFILT